MFCFRTYPSSPSTAVIIVRRLSVSKTCCLLAVLFFPLRFPKVIFFLSASTVTRHRRLFIVRACWDQVTCTGDLSSAKHDSFSFCSPPSAVRLFLAAHRSQPKGGYFPCPSDFLMRLSVVAFLCSTDNFPVTTSSKSFSDENPPDYR